MANLIILEGISRTGKSSITKMLSEKFGFRYISVKNKMPEYVKNLPDFYHGMHIIANEFFSTFQDETFILDRSFISELVYSKSFNRPSYITSDNIIADILHDNRFVIINLSTTHNEYLNRLPKDKKIYSYDEFTHQKDLFYYFYEHFKCYYDNKDWKSRFLEIDTNQFSIEESFNQISALIKKNKLLQILDENAKIQF